MKDIRVGIIGTGGFGSHIIQKLGSLDIIPEIAYGHKNRERYPHIPFTESVSEVIEKCDIIFTAVPPEANYDIAKLALSKNKYVHIEKPMTIDLAHLDLFLDLPNLDKLQVGHCFCYADNIEEISKTWQFAIGRRFRPFAPEQMNIYWNVGIHPISLFEYLYVPSYAVEMMFDDRLEAKDEILFFDLRGNMQRWAPSGDLIKNEILHLIHCYKNGVQPRITVHHGAAVVKELIERYGPIKYCSWRSL